MKVSDVEVLRVRPELLLSIYKCCFLACFCARLIRKAAKSRTNLSDAVAAGRRWRHLACYMDIIVSTNTDRRDQVATARICNEIKSTVNIEAYCT